jgi:hypothetical protein
VTGQSFKKTADASTRRPFEAAAGKQVHVEVRHAFSSIFAVIDDEAEAFVAGADASPLGRVVANAAVMRLTEIDDIHRASCVTVSALTVPVAVAFATDDTSPAQFFDALYVGHELALRLALAAGGARLLTRGQWPSLIVAPFGAAATAGRLLGLSPARMRHALALAVSSAPRQPGRFQGTRSGRWWLFGEAVRSGCMAAMAAADGIDGDPEMLSAEWLKSVGGDLAAPDQLTRHDSAPPPQGLDDRHPGAASGSLTGAEMAPTAIYRCRMGITHPRSINNEAGSQGSVRPILRPRRTRRCNRRRLEEERAKPAHGHGGRRRDA